MRLSTILIVEAPDCLYTHLCSSPVWPHKHTVGPCTYADRCAHTRPRNPPTVHIRYNIRVYVPGEAAVYRDPLQDRGLQGGWRSPHGPEGDSDGVCRKERVRGLAAAAGIRKGWLRAGVPRKGGRRGTRVALEPTLTGAGVSMATTTLAVNKPSTSYWHSIFPAP